MKDVWPVVHAERLALIEDLEPLSESQWSTPSLCAGWSVHDVVAHLVETAKESVPSFVRYFAAARFDFDRYNANGVARERGEVPRETLDEFCRVAFRTSSPPAPRDTRLVEMFVHGEDIRRPLGIGRDYPAGYVVRR